MQDDWNSNDDRRRGGSDWDRRGNRPGFVDRDDWRDDRYASRGQNEGSGSGGGWDRSSGGNYGGGMGGGSRGGGPGGGDPLAVSLSIAVGSHLVDVSPLSTLGALCVATLADPAAQRTLFRRLLVWGLAMIAGGALLCQLAAGWVARL